MRYLMIAYAHHGKQPPEFHLRWFDTLDDVNKAGYRWIEKNTDLPQETTDQSGVVGFTEVKVFRFINSDNHGYGYYYVTEFDKKQSDTAQGGE